ncbi:MAG: hypothetical protein KDI90_11295 [Alphaproteobacteria bacterium]|nr:hypothetical protein [Alphaproteobacteria bacterium]MCB9974379.1 hypothetical protein [Rhodospirillales bacterium]
MTDDTKNSLDLTKLFKNSPLLKDEAAEGPEFGSQEYIKYGVYNDPSGKTAFLCVIMERDDQSTEPEDSLTEDDYFPKKVYRYDLEKNNWIPEPGLMRLISQTSFHFLDSEDEFMDAVVIYMDRKQRESGESLEKDEGPA